MDFDVNTLLIVLPFIFLAGFIDSIAGGGGIISLSGYLLAGLPVHVAMGSNKIQALFGTSVATYNYVSKGFYQKKLVVPSLIGALIGGFLGTQLALMIDDKTLKIAVTIILPIMGFVMIFKKDTTKSIHNLNDKIIYLISFFIGLIIGLYDGLIGPGTGTLLIIAFSLCGLSLIDANGNAKLVNTMSGFISAIIFILNGKYILWLVIPSIIVNVIANYIGSHLALKNGSKIIKPVIILVIILLVLKTLSDIV